MHCTLSFVAKKKVLSGEMWLQYKSCVGSNAEWICDSVVPGKLISALRYSNTHAQRGYPAGPWTNPVTRVWDMSGGREDLPETANIPVRVGCPCARCGGHIPIIPKSHTNSIRSQDFLFAIFLKTYSKWIKPFQPRPLLSSIRRIRVRFSPFSFCPCLFFFLWNFYAVELCIVWDLLSSPGRRRRPPLQKGRDTK